MLNSRELLERKIITGPIEEANISQVGIDLNVVKIERVGSGGIIPKKGKTTLAEYYPIKPDINGYYFLSPGVYNVEFAQGCNIPADVTLLIRQRSSLLRNGSILHSSVFDPGFNTENIGSILIVNTSIKIAHGSRICQIYGHLNNPVEDLYNGQFQNDSQRKGEKKEKKVGT